ncbi:hypothetical protein F3Y22_tig00110156pilonHSYRG00316 [Hibiscus syriacus]|uniref:BRO1 domain-containing protein n=1 Tax=Hibiscus syriacus TaxID=106335 RepID=A0A6A3BJ58_HIBSY|nr:tyrosine-protein phosphatase non-receptor type 23-like [Hibiscus syriacus]KAE8716067.1 hypothetical protein F3Y22_tig00110156pilonHSYRG00316 [Hibiscus syriacus]
MMMHCLQPGKLQSKKIIFEDVFSARDSATLEHLKELSSRRRVIEESINQSSFITEAIAREMSGGLTSHCLRDLQKLEQYLPLLENLVFHVDLVCSNHHVACWISELKIRWSSALNSSSFFNLRGPKFFQIDNLRYELGMTLYLYAALLRERAIEILPTDLVKSATLFREAAGVFEHLAIEIFPSLQSAQSVERPPEATPSICTVMHLICLAEAQAVTIRKAEEKGTTVGLLAKLHYGIIELLGEATAILYSNTGECKDISSSFLEFISSCKALHELRSLKYLAESLKITEQLGVAIGVLRDALTNAKKKVPGEESWRAIFGKEIDAAADMLRKFEHENEFVWHEKIPAGDELPRLQGNKIVNAIPYNPKRWERELSLKI